MGTLECRCPVFSRRAGDDLRPFYSVFPHNCLLFNENGAIRRVLGVLLRLAQFHKRGLYRVLILQIGSFLDAGITQQSSCL